MDYFTNLFEISDGDGDEIKCIKSLLKQHLNQGQDVINDKVLKGETLPERDKNFRDMIRKKE